MIRSVEIAKERLTEAQNHLEAVTKAAYPYGTIVVCSLGGHTVDLEVLGTRGAVWHTPGQLVGKNIKTGKTRTFYDSDVIRIKHNPNKHVTDCTVSTGLMFNGFHVMRSNILPPMTMMVGNDVYKMLTDHMPPRVPNE